MLVTFHVLNQHRHAHRACMPSTGRQLSEVCALGPLITQMKRLGVVFLSELDDLFASDVVLAKRGALSDFIVFIIQHENSVSN